MKHRRALTWLHVIAPIIFALSIGISVFAGADLTGSKVILTDFGTDYYYIVRSVSGSVAVEGSVFSGDPSEVMRELAPGQYTYELFRADGVTEEGQFTIHPNANLRINTTFTGQQPSNVAGVSVGQNGTVSGNTGNQGQVVVVQPAAPVQQAAPVTQPVQQTAPVTQQVQQAPAQPVQVVQPVVQAAAPAQQGGTGTVVFADIGLDYFYEVRRLDGFVDRGSVWPFMGKMGGPVTRQYAAGEYIYQLFREDGVVESGQFTLVAGQQIVVTSGSAPQSSTAATMPVPSQQLVANGALMNANVTKYIVQQGDTLSSIARMFGIDQKVILGMNPELAKNPNMLWIGEMVMIPGSQDASLGAPAVAQTQAVAPPVAPVTQVAGAALPAVASGNSMIGGCYGGNTQTAYERQLDRPGELLSLMALKVWDIHPAPSGTPGEVCVTLAAKFTGGQSAHGVLINGQQALVRGPVLMSTPEAEIGHIDFDVRMQCGQTMDIRVSLTSADGQVTQQAFAQHIPCP